MILSLAHPESFFSNGLKLPEGAQEFKKDDWFTVLRFLKSVVGNNIHYTEAA